MAVYRLRKQSAETSSWTMRQQIAAARVKAAVVVVAAAGMPLGVGKSAERETLGRGRVETMYWWWRWWRWICL